MITGGNLTAHAVAMGAAIGMSQDTVCMSGLGVYHVASMALELTALHHGGRVVVATAADPAAPLHELVRQRVTHTLMVPSILQAFLEVPGVTGLDYSHLKALAYGATPIQPALLRRCLDAFPVPFFQGYGLTETCSAFCVLPDREHRDAGHPRRLESAGRPLPGAEIEIADPASGARLRAGHIGEVLLRSRQVMLGYWDGTGPDTSAITPDGWLRTGDAGHLDEDGYLYISGRLKDMYLHDGWNVYAAVVERVLASGCWRAIRMSPRRWSSASRTPRGAR